MADKEAVKKQAAFSKSNLRGTMNEEELRYNKHILKEISAKKKELKGVLA